MNINLIVTVNFFTSDLQTS